MTNSDRRQRMFELTKRQNGAVIVVALVFVMLMTLMATYAFRGVSTNVKIGGKQYSAEIAARSTEAALMSCQRLVINGVRLRPDGLPAVPYWPPFVYPILPSINGYQDDKNRFFWQIPGAWQTGAKDQIGGSVQSFDITQYDKDARIPGVVANPRCFVEMLRSASGVNMDTTLTYAFRITVIGYGLSLKSFQMQQIIYQPYPGGSALTTAG